MLQCCITTVLQYCSAILLQSYSAAVIRCCSIVVVFKCLNLCFSVSESIKFHTYLHTEPLLEVLADLKNKI